MEHDLPKLAIQSPDGLFFALCTKLCLSQGRCYPGGTPSGPALCRGRRREKCPHHTLFPLHSDGWKDQKSWLKVKNHSIFFLVPSALEEGGMCDGGVFKLWGTEKGPLCGSSSAFEATYYA